MGREIRRVPSDWQHPKRKDIYVPMYDEDYDTASQKYQDGVIAWANGDKRDEEGKLLEEKYYWQYYGNPPSLDHYRQRKWTPEEATHYQMYETVSEGTPVTPVFATLEDLADWLVNKGEMADTMYERRYSREAADAFCKEQWAPSLVVMNGKLMTGVESLGDK